MRIVSVSSFFTAIQNIDTVYSTNGNSHLMKNMEWGAVAYLKQSKYGLGLTDIGINKYQIANEDGSYTYMTGCGSQAGSGITETCNAYDTTSGMLASTTGNVYGVYDMSGGAYEYVMGNEVNTSGAFYNSSAGFASTNYPERKYYDAYAYSTSGLTHGRGKLGDATKETLKTYGNVYGGWNGDCANFTNSNNSWFIRGGSVHNDYAGFSSTHGVSSSNVSARAVAFK